jgi:hypothetical protein
VHPSGCKPTLHRLVCNYDDADDAFLVVNHESVGVDILDTVDPATASANRALLVIVEGFTGCFDCKGHY